MGSNQRKHGNTQNLVPRWAIRKQKQKMRNRNGNGNGNFRLRETQSKN